MISQYINSTLLTKFKQYIYLLNKRSQLITVKYVIVCLSDISDKYLPLTTFLGVGHPGLENIDKFPLEGTSPPSSCRGTQLILVLK